MTPLQQKYPWRATVRTVFQVLIGLAALLPVLLPSVGVSTTAGIGAGVMTVCLVVTRVMQAPALEQFLQNNIPWLAAAPKPVVEDDWSDWPFPAEQYTETYEPQHGEADDGTHADATGDGVTPSILPEAERG